MNWRVEESVTSNNPDKPWPTPLYGCIEQAAWSAYLFCPLALPQWEVVVDLDYSNGHVRYHSGYLLVDNPSPQFFEISATFRPADRIAYQGRP